MKTDAEKERAARAAAELKETEDLLAGFDRPARTPRAAPVAQDFVDYHLNRGSKPGARRMAPGPAPQKKQPEPTFVIPRKRKGALPPWTVLGALLAVMFVGGVVVTYVAIGHDDSGASPGERLPSLAPGTTTTTAAAPSAQPSVRTDDIPPPVVPPAPLSEPSAAPTAPRASSSAATTSTASTAKPSPATSTTKKSGDFMHEL